MAVDAFYTGSFGSANPLSEGDMATAVAAAFGGLLSAPAGSESRAIYDLFDDPNYAVLVGTGVTDSGEPRAYLNYMFFDQDFNFVSGKSGFRQISDLAGDDSVPEPLAASVSIDQGGFLYVYVSNETIVDFKVYFDELTITHTKGSILQEDHYYPFGMNISALSSTAPLAKPNRYKYNGNEEQLDFDWNIYDFNARMYDPMLGRFSSIDPLADDPAQDDLSPYQFGWNNPILYEDAFGLCPECPDNGKENQVYVVNGATYVHDGEEWVREDGEVSGATVTPTGVTINQANRLNNLLELSWWEGKRVTKNRNGLGGSIDDALGQRQWFNPFNGVTYNVDYRGYVSGITPIMGIPPDISRGGGVLRIGKVAKGIENARILRSVVRKGIIRTDYLFSNRGRAMNWARRQLGHNTTKLYDKSGKLIGWQNKAGDTVYWGHGDWGAGKGSSTFPHLNYKIGNTKGHLFLQDKIKNRGMLDSFKSYFKD